MSENNNKQRRSEIIRRYYEGEYDRKSKECPSSEAKIKRWLLNMQNSAEFNEIERKLWEAETGDLTKDFSVQKQRIFESLGIDEEVKPLLVKKRKPFKMLFLRAAAVLIPILAIAGIWLSQSQGENSSPLLVDEYSSPKGVVSCHILEDSSEVWINSSSSLAVEYGNDRRTVKLSGEAYFSVAKDKKKPFCVSAGDLKVIVLGTKFNVAAYPDSKTTVVALMEGSIQLDMPNGENLKLLPNEQFTYYKDTKKYEVKQLKEEVTTDKVQWIEGHVLCDMETLPEIFIRLERRCNVSFKIESDVELSDKKYRFEFKQEDSPEFIMSVLKSVSEEFDYDIDNETITIKK